MPRAGRHAPDAESHSWCSPRPRSLFSFGDAPMLALASQKLALSHAGHEAALTSSAIIVAQLAAHSRGAFRGWATSSGVSHSSLWRSWHYPRMRGALPLRTTLLGLLPDEILDRPGRSRLLDALLPLPAAQHQREPAAPI